MKKRLCLYSLWIWSALLIWHCFNAPMPEYLRPGHPDWPVAWQATDTSVALDDRLKLACGLFDCVPLFLTDSIPDRHKILGFCEKMNLKMYLVYESSSDDPDIAIRQALQDWRTANDGTFPVQIIPALVIGHHLTISGDSLRNIIASEARGMLLLADEEYPVESIRTGLFNGIVRRPEDTLSPSQRNMLNETDRIDLMKLSVVRAETLKTVNADVILWELKTGAPADSIPVDQITQQRRRMKMRVATDMPFVK